MDREFNWATLDKDSLLAVVEWFEMPAFRRIVLPMLQAKEDTYVRLLAQYAALTGKQIEASSVAGRISELGDLVALHDFCLSEAKAVADNP